MGSKIRITSKIHAMKVDASQFWWAWPLWFYKIAPSCMPSKQPIFPVYESQKLESAQVTCSLLDYLRCTIFSKMNAEIFRLAVLLVLCALGLFSTCIMHVLCFSAHLCKKLD